MEVSFEHYFNSIFRKKCDLNICAKVKEAIKKIESRLGTLLEEKLKEIDSEKYQNNSKRKEDVKNEVKESVASFNELFQRLMDEVIKKESVFSQQDNPLNISGPSIPRG